MILVNLASALTFVSEHANPVEQARLDYLLNAHAPSCAAVESLLADQQPDGGWSPFWAPRYTSLDATCFRLAQAEQMGIATAHQSIQCALTFLAQRQHADGSWEEDQSVAEIAPPWVMPGDRAARLYLTANCAFWLAVHEAAPDRARLAADYLQKHMHEEERSLGFLQTHWLAAALYYRLERREAAQQVLHQLSARIDALSAADLAWLIIALRAAGVGIDHAVMSAAAARLEQCQSEDGRWPSDEGAQRDVHTTLEALRALRLSGRF